MTSRRALAALFVLVTVAACSDVTTNSVAPSPATTTSTTNTTTRVVADIIEFHVLGLGVTQAMVRYVTSRDGANATTTGLPFYVALDSTQPTLFVALDATATMAPLPSAYMLAEIWINGAMFRSASSSGVAPFTVSLSGTWRRPNTGASED